MELRRGTTTMEREQLASKEHIPMEMEKSNSAFENDKSIIFAKGQLQAMFIDIAQLLYENKRLEYWKVLDYDSFEAYIANPDISLDRSTVYRLLQVYETFVIQYGVAPARLYGSDYSKLAEVLPVVRPDNYEEWLSKADDLSRSDLRDEIREFRGLPEREVTNKVDLQTLVDKVLSSKSKRVTFEHSGQKFTLTLVQEKVAKEERVPGALVNELITLFEPINPSFEQLFKRPNERQAIVRLVEKHGEDWLKKLITVLPDIISQKYAPRVTTPVQLENKLGEIRVFIEQQKGSNAKHLDLRQL